MKKIIDIKNAIEIANELKTQNKKIVICGGCFDILHIGHIKFLEKAKEKGDFLFVLLESDKNVSKLKGEQRPINLQRDRAEILSALIFVDFVVLLPEMKLNIEYDNLIERIKPDIIAVTKGSGQTQHAQRQAQNINANVISVISNIEDKSTSSLAKIILEKFT